MKSVFFKHTRVNSLDTARAQGLCHCILAYRGRDIYSILRLWSRKAMNYKCLWISPCNKATFS